MSTHTELDQGFQGSPELFPGIAISNTMMASALAVCQKNTQIFLF